MSKNNKPENRSNDIATKNGVKTANTVLNTLRSAGTFAEAAACTFRASASPLFEKVRPAVDNKLEDAEDMIKATRAYNKACEIAGTAKTKISRAHNGYSKCDLWNLGDYLIDREEEMLDILSEQRYNNVDIEWFRKLKSNADYLRSYKRKYALLDSLPLANSSNRKNMLDKQMELNAKLQDEFVEHWIEIGNVLYTDKFTLPQLHTNSIGNRMYDAVLKLRSKTGASEAALRETFQKDELSLLSTMFYELAGNAQGSPHNYTGSKYELMERGNKWLESQASIALVLHGNSEIIDDYREQDGHLKKNKDIGDYAAWIEDLVHVARVLGEWGDWLDAKREINISPKEEYDFQEVEDMISSEFHRCWKWIGINITALWD